MSVIPLMPFGLTIRTLVHACRSLCSVNWQVFLVRHSSVSVSRGFAICEYARFRTEFEASRLRMFITLPLSTRTSNEGSQARSKATDLNSVLAGVLRFKPGSRCLASEKPIGMVCRRGLSPISYVVTNDEARDHGVCGTGRT